MDIKVELNKLADYQAQRQVLALKKQELIDKVNAEKQARIDEILTPELREKIQAIEMDTIYELSDICVELDADAAALEPNITVLTADIKAAVVQGGASVKGSFLQAVYSKPRVTWDTGKLEGLALAFPPLLEARKVGEASVSIRDVKP